MKLIKTTICNANTLTKADREQYIVPPEYNRRVVLEIWKINGELRYKSSALLNIRDYLLSLGDFKDVDIDDGMGNPPEEVEDVLKEESVGYDCMRKKRLMHMYEKFENILPSALKVIDSAKNEDILDLELKFLKTGGVVISTAKVTTANDFINEAFGNKDTPTPTKTPKTSINKSEQAENLLNIMKMVKDMIPKHDNEPDVFNISKMKEVCDKMSEYDKTYTSGNKTVAFEVNRLRALIEKMEKYGRNV